MKKIDKVLYVIGSITVLFATSATAVYAQAKDWSADCLDPNRPAGIKCLESVFGNLVSVLVSLAGLALFVMLVIGGYKYLMSAGDPEKTQSARNTMFYAIVGIVVMVSAYIVLQAIKWFTGIDVLNFEIKTFPAPTP